MEKVNFKKPYNINKSTRKRKLSISNSASEDETQYSEIHIEKKKNTDTDDEINRGEFGVCYKSKCNAVILGPNDQGAKATNEAETEKDKVAQAILEDSLEIYKDLEEIMGVDRIYSEMYNIPPNIEEKDTASGNVCGLERTSVLLRPSVKWIYQPEICKYYKETRSCKFGDSCKFLHDNNDCKAKCKMVVRCPSEQSEICKDYKETGLCGFGYSCKFVHDDSEYEPDWLMEESWTAIGECESDESSTFKCAVCVGSVVNPVATKCEHYFCEKCVRENYKKSSRCYLCEPHPNGGSYPAKELLSISNCTDETKCRDIDFEDVD